MSEKIYLQIPYEHRDVAKNVKCRFDKEAKLWYTEDKKNGLISQYKVIPLQIKYEDKDLAKSIGCKFNGKLKTWYCLPDNQKALDTFIS
jgi:hypothetical protein